MTLSIANLQTSLKNLGLYDGQVDGDFGPISRNAFMAAMECEAAPLAAAETIQAAAAHGLTVAQLGAVMDVESKGKGIDPATKLPIILYEPHIFHRYTGGVFDVDHPDLSYAVWGSKPYPVSQADRWTQLRQAVALDSEAALKSVSYGLFQVMGFNYDKCGFPGVWSFVLAMASGESAQLEAALKMMDAIGMVSALKACDWPRAARLWNGSGQMKAYGDKLAVAYARRMR